VTGGGIDPGDAGIKLDNVEYCNVTRNRIMFDNFYGIFLSYSDNNTILRNNVTNSPAANIYLEYSHFNQISSNQVNDSGLSGIYLMVSSNNNIDSNLAFNNVHGFYLTDSNDNSISYNTASNIQDNIRVSSSDSNIIHANTLSNADDYGIYLIYTKWTTVTDNTMIEGGLYMQGDELDHWVTHTIDTSNTVTGKPVYYWKNQIGGTVPAGAGEVILANCQDVLVTDQECNNGSVGIILGFSSQNNITENDAFSNSRYGISLYQSHSNNITDCNLQNNYCGLRLENSNSNHIKRNLALNNTLGIWIQSSNDNNIIHNNVISNTDTGFYIRYSSFNLFYNNNIIDNNNQAYDNRPDNNWNTTYPTGGNYWSDYSGSDLFSGPSQTDPGSDQIGDTPYSIPDNGQDNYPLMNPWSPPDPTPPQIDLVEPSNGSIIKSNTILDFSISDSDLDVVTYSVDGNPSQQFDPPYDIITSGWGDEEYVIDIYASDTMGHTTERWFRFTLDSTRPIIVLNNPGNNSIIPDGTLLDFAVSDTHLDQVTYSINGGGDVPFSNPFNIYVDGWNDGSYIISIDAYDAANNSNSFWFQFTFDSTHPQIILNSPLNGSLIAKGIELDFTISDVNLDRVNYTVNGGSEIPFNSPFNIQTGGWQDDNYIILIIAFDKAGNSNSSWFQYKTRNLS
jgi:parallel beta-helix repeat protein